MNKTFKRKEVNGHSYNLLTLPGTDLFKFEIVNMYGANIERAVSEVSGVNVYGLSHFIEHLGFRAPKDYTTEQLMKAIKQEGTYNASTDHDRINYWFKTNTQRADTAIKLVCNYALNDLTNISQEEFDTEKKVVYNECKRYADDDQTMFYFNTTGAICGYHPEDNVIGIPETVDAFQLADAINIKSMFLNEGKQVLNITYDPTQLTEEEVISKVEAELKRHTWEVKSYPNIVKAHNELMETPKEGEFKLDCESEQVMTALFIDNIYNVMTARVANAYLSRYSETSLTDIIREQNGLTYGVSFSDTSVSYNPYTAFMCDVTKGTEGLLMELMKESINKSIDEYTREKHEELINIIELKRTLMMVDQQKYDGVHWLAIWNPEVIDQYGVEFGDDIESAYTKIRQIDCSYEVVLDYFARTRDMINNKEYSKVTNG